MIGGFGGKIADQQPVLGSWFSMAAMLA